MNEKQMVIKCLEQFDTKQEKVSEILFNVYPDEMNSLIRLVKKCNKHIVSNNEVALKAFVQKFVNDCELGDSHEPLHLEEAKRLL